LTNEGFERIGFEDKDMNHPQRKAPGGDPGADTVRNII